MNQRFYDIASRVVDLLMDVVCVVDEHGVFVYISSSCEKVFGYTQQEMLGTNMINYVHPEDRNKTLAIAAQIMRGKEQPYFENRYVRKDGSTVYIMWSARWQEEDKVRVAVARDITEYKRFERTQNSIYKISQMAHKSSNPEQLCQDSYQLIKSFIDIETFIVCTRHSEKNQIKLTYSNDQQYPTGASFSVDSKTAISEIIEKRKTLMANSNGHSPLEVSKDEKVRFHQHGNWLGIPLTTQEKVIGVLIIGTANSKRYSNNDISLLEYVAEQFAVAIERKDNEQKLHHLASHDWLTGLPNRMLFNDRMEVAINRAKRIGEKVALLYMDLDGFKEVNDSLGHAKGDLLLSKVAVRIKSCVRESDTIARMGGDEFTVLLTEIHGREAVENVSKKIKDALKGAFNLDGNDAVIGISIGIAVYPDDGENSESLLKIADNAMYDDKRQMNAKKQ